MRHDQFRAHAAYVDDQHLRTVELSQAGDSARTAIPRPSSVAAFREALGHYASGITVIAGHDAEGPIGFTCQSFYSVSVEPPLVSFGVQRNSKTYPRIRAAGSFVVNVLAHDQQHVADQFSHSGADKWAGIAWSPTQAGNPALDGTLSWLDCRIWAEHDAGDHVIVLGQVEEIGLPDAQPGDPLLYFRSRYRQLSQ